MQQLYLVNEVADDTLMLAPVFRHAGVAGGTRFLRRADAEKLQLAQADDLYVLAMICRKTRFAHIVWTTPQLKTSVCAKCLVDGCFHVWTLYATFMAATTLQVRGCSRLMSSLKDLVCPARVTESVR